jgi:hypothetical protein
MLGFKRFRNASIGISGIELMHRIRKGQFDLASKRLKETAAPVVWNAALSADDVTANLAFFALTPDLYRNPRATCKAPTHPCPKNGIGRAGHSAGRHKRGARNADRNPSAKHSGPEHLRCTLPTVHPLTTLCINDRFSILCRLLPAIPAWQTGCPSPESGHGYPRIVAAPPRA